MVGSHEVLKKGQNRSYDQIGLPYLELCGNLAGLGQMDVHKDRTSRDTGYAITRQRKRTPETGAIRHIRQGH